MNRELVQNYEDLYEEFKFEPYLEYDALQEQNESSISSTSKFNKTRLPPKIKNPFVSY